MLDSLPRILRCPACHEAGRWALSVDSRDEREIREGRLRCEGCGTERPIGGGVVDLLGEPPEFVVREAAGLALVAQDMRNDGWDREKVLQLPDVKLGYWHHQATGMMQVLGGSDVSPQLRPGRRILDVGANTCWASAMLAEHGLDVVALDIATHEMQGLSTADWWFEDRAVYFERVLGLMSAPPFADESFDLIFCCEVLHHNDRAHLARTMREAARLLKPGGTMIVVNEPVRALRSPKLRPPREVARYEGNEHAFLRATYVRAARRAGLDARAIGPWLAGAFNEQTWGISPETRVPTALRMALFQAVRRVSFLRRAYLAWRTYVDGMSLYMVATKPARG